MPKNYLIGIGGTGARVIESFVYLSAAGYGPDNEVTIFFIDPDKANGNLERTTAVVDNYIKCRSNFASAGSVTPLFKTKISRPAECVWNIFDKADESLSTHINYRLLKSSNQNFAELISLLYSGGHASSDDEHKGELGTKLNEGFRGHPSIGAVVMTDAHEQRHKDPWKTLFMDIENATGENDIRVFLVGSIFGGTGAAGVPTIGSRGLIKENEQVRAKLSNGRSKVFLGGALVLPYFVFDTTGSSRETGLFVTSADFAVATKAALHYYSEKALEGYKDKDGGLGFDQVFFIGDESQQNVGSFSAGTATQKNNPHFIEMATSLAAKDFFEQLLSAESSGKYFIASRKDGPFSWESFPMLKPDTNTPVNQQQVLKAHMLRMTIFAYSICTYGKVKLDSWYKTFFDEKKKETRIYNLQDQANKLKVEGYTGFLNDFLKWICAICSDTQTVKLIDSTKILNGEELYPASPTSQNIADLLPDWKPDKKDEVKFSIFIQGLNETKPKDAPSTTIDAADRLLVLFYNETNQFVSKYYKIN